MRICIVLIICFAQLATGQSREQVSKRAEQEPSSLRPNEIWEAQRNAFIKARLGQELPVSPQPITSNNTGKKPTASEQQARELYRIPFGARENNIELSIRNSLTSASTIQVRLSSAPAWLKCSQRELSLNALGAGETRSVSLSFDVENTAIVNMPQSFVFSLSNSSGEVWTKEIKVVVTPPERIELLQNYPNPFNPSTTISYVLPAAGHVRLTVYNVLGQEVARLVEERQPPGRHEKQWEAMQQASGLYIYQLVLTNGQGEHTIAHRAMLLLK